MIDEEKAQPASIIQFLFVVVIACGILLAAHVLLATGLYAAAAACLAASVGLAVGLWKLSQKTRALALVVLLALLVYAVMAAWDPFLSDSEEGASVAMKLVLALLVLATLLAVVLILHPSVRRVFIGDPDKLADARRGQEEIWGLKEELARREHGAGTEGPES